MENNNEGLPPPKVTNGKESASFHKDGETVNVTHQEPTIDGTEKESMCGIFSWRPASLQKFADMRILTMVLSVMSLLNGVVFAYYNAVITSIENRFGLSSSMMGFVKNIDGIGYTLSIIIISHFCRFANKPRLFACACVLSAFATALFGFPHLLYGSGDPAKKELDEVINSTESVTRSKFTQFCEESNNGTDYEMCKEKAENTLGQFSAGALVCFIASEFLQGVSNSPAVSLGITYVDDNMGGKSPKYIAWMFATRALAPFIGYGLGAWCVSMYVDLTDVDLSQKDPRWVGAWWLGFMIIGVAMLIWTFPVVMFPGKMPGEAAKEKGGNLTSMIKDLPKALVRLAKNPLYICLIAGMSCNFCLMGFFTFVPKYIEKHFLQTPAMASIMAGIISAFGWALGPILGGQFLTKQCRTPRGAMKLVVCLSLFTLGCYTILMFLSCPTQHIAGGVTTSEFDVAQQCNGDCSCRDDKFEPVCNVRGDIYYNPCFAGCPNPMSDRYNSSSSGFSHCSCVGEEEIVMSQYCDNDCKTFIPYVVTLFISSLANGMYIIPSVMSLLRCVDYKDKAIGVAVSTSIPQIISFPAPLLFGYAIDNTCLIKDSECGEEGRCLVYDKFSFRFTLHGLALGVKAAAIIFYIIGFFFSRMDRYDVELAEDDDKKDKQISDPESREKFLNSDD